jgi:UbiD family decarboxylase
VIVRDPEYGRNAAIHRLMLVDERHLAIRTVEKRGTHTALQKHQDKLPVAIAVGCPIQALLASAMSPAKGVDELGIANALVTTDLVHCQTVDLEVPAAAELVLEGYITTTEIQEGGFPDLTGTMDIIRMQRVIEIQQISHRRKPVFHALLPGGLEHKNLMGMPREPAIFAAANRACKCTGVYLTPGGVSWLHAVVQIDKQDEHDGEAAIAAAFEGHPSLKHVVVVDTDIDVYSVADVEWAIATRFQADRDLWIFTDQDSSSLDPSAIKIPGRKAHTSKMGLDATAPLGAARREYERVTYDPIELHKYGLQKL